MLPGVIPTNTSYTVDSTVVTPAHPVFLNLGTDFPDGAQSTGNGTPYPMPLDLNGAINRAWLTRGWNTFQLTSVGNYTPGLPSGAKVKIFSDKFLPAGAIYNDYALPGSTIPPGVGPGGDTPGLGEWDISLFTPNIGTTPLNPPSFGVWSAISGGISVGGPSYPPDVFSPTGSASFLYGRNRTGNFTLPLGAALPAASLDWEMRLAAGDMTQPYAPSVVIKRIPLPVADPTYPFFKYSDIDACRPYTPGGPTPSPVMVPHSLVIRATAYGNASCVRCGSTGSWQYPAIFWFTLSAAIEPDPTDGIDYNTDGYFGVVVLDTDMDHGYTASVSGGQTVASTLASSNSADISRPYYSSSPVPATMSLYADGVTAMSSVPLYIVSGSGDFTGVAAWVDFVKFLVPDSLG